MKKTYVRHLLVLGLIGLTLASAGCTAQSMEAPPALSPGVPAAVSAAPDGEASGVPAAPTPSAAPSPAATPTTPTPVPTSTPKATPVPTPAPALTPKPTPVPTPIPTPAPTPEPMQTPSAPTAADARACVGRSVSALYAAIGYPPNGSSYASSCLGDGEDGELYYSGFTVYTYRENGAETVQNVF